MPPYDFPSFHFSFPVQIHFLSGKIGKLHQLHTIPIAQTNLKKNNNNKKKRKKKKEKEKEKHKQTDIGGKKAKQFLSPRFLNFLFRIIIFFC